MRILRPFVLIVLVIIIAILVFSIWLVNQLVTGQTDFYTIAIALIAVLPILVVQWQRQKKA